MTLALVNFLYAYYDSKIVPSDRSPKANYNIKDKKKCASKKLIDLCSSSVVESFWVAISSHCLLAICFSVARHHSE